MLSPACASCRNEFPSLSCRFDFLVSLWIVRRLEGGLSTTFEGETAVVRRRGFSLVSAVCGDFFSSHRRSSAGDAPWSARSHVACVSNSRKIKKILSRSAIQNRSPRKSKACKRCRQSVHRVTDCLTQTKKKRLDLIRNGVNSIYKFSQQRV